MADDVVAQDHGICIRCGETKSASEFFLPRTGQMSRKCKPCRNFRRTKEYADWQIKNPIVRERTNNLEWRQCRICGERKKIDEFGPDSRCHLGRAWQCRHCANLAHVRWAERNREHVRDSARAARRRAYSKNRKREKMEQRARRLKKQYGLSLEEYEDRFNKQGGTCPVCQGKMLMHAPAKTPMYQVPCVDHDHETGQVRGILCSVCNRAIGIFGDSPARLMRAHDYLKSWGKT